MRRLVLVAAAACALAAIVWLAWPRRQPPAPQSTAMPAADRTDGGEGAPATAVLPTLAPAAAPASAGRDLGAPPPASRHPAAAPAEPSERAAATEPAAPADSGPAGAGATPPASPVPVEPAAPAPRLAATLRGRVVQPGGAPVTRFTVNGSWSYDPDGRFEVPIDGRERLRLLIRAGRFAPALVRVPAEALRSGELPEVVLDAGHDLAGQVLDARTLHPVAGARVALADPGEVEEPVSRELTRIVEPVASDGSGAFLIPHAPQGEWLLLVSHPGHVMELSLVSRPTPVKVLLQAGGSILGTLLGSAGQPLAGRRMVALSGSSFDEGEATTDASGRFSMGPLRPGRYVLVPIAEHGDGGAWPAPVPVDLGEGETERVVVRASSAGATLRVKAFRADGRPAPAGALLVAGDVPPPASLAALLEAGPVFAARGQGSPQVIAGVPPGSYTLFLLEEGRGRAGLYRQPLQVTEGGEMAVEVHLPEALPPLPYPLQVRFTASTSL